MSSVQGNVPPPLSETVVDRGSYPHTQVTMKDHCLSPLLWILGTPPTSTVSTLKDLNPASKYQLRRELLTSVKVRTIAPTIIVHNLQILDRYAFCAGDAPRDLNTPVHYFSCQWLHWYWHNSGNRATNSFVNAALCSLFSFTHFLFNQDNDKSWIP